MEGAATSEGTGLDLVLRFLEREIRDGVGHGFFDFQLKCEVINGKKRRLILKAGKTHQFVIPADEDT